MFTADIQNKPVSELATPDGNNATYIDPNDVGESEYWPADYLYLEKQKYFQHQNDINSGRKNGPTWFNDSNITYELARDLIDTISAELDLTGPQRWRARRYYTNLDRGALGQKLELSAYCLCAYLVERDDRNSERRCHPSVPNERRDKVFNRVARSLGLDQAAIQSMYGKIQHRIGSEVPPPADDRRDPDHYPWGGT